MNACRLVSVRCRFQGNDGSRDSTGGIRNGDIGDIFADTGGANLRLVHRVTKVFTPDLTSMLVSAQVSRMPPRISFPGQALRDRFIVV